MINWNAPTGKCYLEEDPTRPVLLMDQWSWALEDAGKEAIRDRITLVRWRLVAWAVAASDEPIDGSVGRCALTKCAPEKRA